MANKYEEMSITELEGEMARLRTKKQALQEQLREAHAVYDLKREEQAAKAKIAQMSDSEKRALVQAIYAEEIGSSETFGNF